MKEQISNRFIVESKDNELEIDLKEILNTFLRNKNFIAIFGTIFLILTGIKIITSERYWEGEFKVDLSEINNLSSKLAAERKNINERTNVLPYIEQKNKLKTQVSILESQSILLPAFNLVKEEKEKLNSKFKDLKFSNWKSNNLEIEIEDGTSFINVSYKDTDKKVIIPVLKKISENFFLYSGRDRKNGIEKGIVYLKNEIKKYKEKSLISSQKAKKYSIEQNLLDSKQINENTYQNNLEIQRVKAFNEITLSNSLIKSLDAFENDKETLYFISRLIRLEEDDSNLSNYISSLDIELTELRSNFNENNIDIQDILKKREIAIDSFITETYRILNAKKLVAEASLISVERPKEVLTKFATLKDNSVRDLSILESLENQLRILSLEKASFKDPLKIIKEPTLIGDPILSTKKILLLLGISGFLLGAFLALILERRKDLIYSENEFANAIGLHPILRLKLKDKSLWLESLSIFSNLINPREAKENVVLLKTGNISEKYSNQFESNLNSKYSSEKIFITKDIIAIKNYAKKFLIIQQGTITRKRLNEILNYLKLLSIDLDGWILLI